MRSTRSITATLTEAFATSTAVVAVGPSLYLGLLTILASRASSSTGAGSPDTDRTSTFAVCIPAHNEQANIRHTVDALLAQDYPRSSFSVHVVADNCSDSTAAEARAAGAIAHIRTDPDHRGKGEALNWLTARIRSEGADVVVIIDADTEADPGFLAALDRAFGNGAHAAQGYYAVKDPETSPAVGLRFAAIACRHRLRPLARTKFGASSGLYGNGMAFRSDLLVDRRWSNHLIEDAEFQMDLLLDGHLVTYVPDAVVRAEMPATLEAATSQNERWELGRMQLVGTYVPLLVRRALTGGTLPRRAYLDAAADHLTPPLTLQALIDTAAVAMGVLACAGRPSRTSKLALATGVGCSLILASHVLVGLRLADAPPSVYRSLRSAPRAAFWKLMLLARIARRPHDVSWTRTERNATLAMDRDD
jgi:1,2-diacylglycerol 3-beta-glucosyltransferase